MCQDEFWNKRTRVRAEVKWDDSHNPEPQEPLGLTAFANLRHHKTGNYKKNVHSKTANCMEVKLLSIMTKGDDTGGQSAQGLEAIDLGTKFAWDFHFALQHRKECAAPITSIARNCC